MVLGDDFSDRHDMRTVTLRICGQQPQNAGARPLRMHQPVSMLNSLERMMCQRFVNPLFYFAGHDCLVTRSTPRARNRGWTARGEPGNSVQEFSATHRQTSFVMRNNPIVTGRPCRAEVTTAK